MLKKILFFSLLLPLLVQAQVSQDVTVPLTATVSMSPASVLNIVGKPDGREPYLASQDKGAIGYPVDIAVEPDWQYPDQL